MPSNQALIEEVQELLLTSADDIMFCLKTPAALSKWINYIYNAKRSGLFGARRYLITELKPAVKDFRKLFCIQSESQWIIDLDIYSDTNEVRQLKIRMLKVRSVWANRPNIRNRGSKDAVQNAARKARIYNPSEASLPAEIKGVAH